MNTNLVDVRLLSLFNHFIELFHRNWDVLGFLMRITLEFGPVLRQREGENERAKSTLATDRERERERFHVFRQMKCLLLKHDTNVSAQHNYYKFVTSITT